MQVPIVTHLAETQKISPITQATQQTYAAKPIQTNAKGLTFSQVLKEQQENQDVAMALQFSKHASLRLSSRNIQLTKEQISRVENGVNSARKKGISDSLVLVDNVALLVNIASKTVVTALSKEQNVESVFTNIDGAVIV